MVLGIYGKKKYNAGQYVLIRQRGIIGKIVSIAYLENDSLRMILATQPDSNERLTVHVSDVKVIQPEVIVDTITHQKVCFYTYWTYCEDGMTELVTMEMLQNYWNQNGIGLEQIKQGTTFDSWLDEMEHMGIYNRITRAWTE